MPTFQTSHGAVDVDDWGYMLQGPNGAALSPAAIATAPHDLIVIDFSRDGTLSGQFTAAEVDAMNTSPAGERVLLSYISIGEIEDFRHLWNASWTTNHLANGTLTASAPDWLGPVNPDWPESRKVRYWDPGWQALIFNDAGTGWLDTIVAQGFDGAYLDIVDAYYYWAVEAPASVREPGDPAAGDEQDAAIRMIDFIVAMTAHARETNPDFFVIIQNGAFILDALADADPARRAAFLDAIGGIGVEDTYFPGPSDENNPFAPDAATVDVLIRDFLGNGEAVFAIDYVNQPNRVAQFMTAALDDGVIPYIGASRALDVLSAPVRGPDAATAGVDHLAGTAGADTINALGGADVIAGRGGNDTIWGGNGNDLLNAGTGNDLLSGGAGTDTLQGGQGSDTVTYAGAGAGVTVSLALTNAQATGGAGTDTLSGIESLIGSALADRLTGNTAANTLNGGGGNDTLSGGGGNDRLDGATGNDSLDGGSGADTLTGGAGQDTLSGGIGADRFDFNSAAESRGAAADLIADFDGDAGDRIDLADVYAGTLTFTGASFSGAGSVRVAGPLSAQRLEVDLNGDGVADMAIVVASARALTGGDLSL